MSESARLITINPTSIDDALVVEAGAALAEGRLVAIPTETVYGLGCNALIPTQSPVCSRPRADRHLIR